MSDSSNSRESPADKLKVSKVISGKNQTEYERWEVPNVKTLKQQQLKKAGLTASQLEKLHNQAYDDGFKLGKKEGYEEGLKQGQEEGHQKGLESGQKEVSQTLKYFEQVMTFLAEPIEQVNEDVEEELIQLSMATAKQIIRREITIDPGQIMAVIREALSALPSNSKQIKVYLHPLDAQIVRDNLGSSTNLSQDDTETQDVISNNRHEPDDEIWSVVDEPNITRGGCQIKSEFSQIDASIDTRIAEISARLLGSERASSETDDRENDELEPVTASEDTQEND
ncbi:MAG: flagellar assembly protein FliH [Gammaproteobacteria bacterium]|nr:flagellar assembly protein FliH [Gammaproteobacteria bacterium]